MRVIGRRLLFVIPLATFALATACSKSSPVAPAGSTASVKGAIVAGTAASTGGVTVSVVGLSTSAALDSSHQFTLRGVPAQYTQLQFTGPGTNARVNIGTLTAGKALTLTLNVSGNSGSVITSSESDEDEDIDDLDPPTSPSDVEIEGLVQGLPPFTAAGSFIVNDHLVLTDGSTLYRHGDTTMTFADLQIGTRVHVKGTPSGSSTLATLVIFQDPNTNTNVNLNGTISALSGSAASFQFIVNGTAVKGDASTSFIGGAFSNLTNGTKVEIKATQMNGFVQATRIHILK